MKQGIPGKAASYLYKRIVSREFSSSLNLVPACSVPFKAIRSSQLNDSLPAKNVPFSQATSKRSPLKKKGNYPRGRGFSETNIARPNGFLTIQSHHCSSLLRRLVPKRYP